MDNYYHNWKFIRNFLQKTISFINGIWKLWKMEISLGFKAAEKWINIPHD